MKTLIVIDMQNDFIDGSLGSKEAVEIVPAVKEKISEYRANGDEVIFTRDTHHEDYLNTNEGQYLPVVHCIENTSGWQLNRRVANALKKIENYEIINKPTFGSDQLSGRIAAYCKPEEIESITLIGLCTDICVVSNAMLLKTAFMETEIRCIASCCAGVTPANHDAALATMKMCQVKVI